MKIKKIIKLKDKFNFKTNAWDYSSNLELLNDFIDYLIVENLKDIKKKTRRMNFTFLN